MNNEMQNKIKSFLLIHNELAGSPATDHQIEAAEKTLSTRFHAEYIEFIKLFGGSYAGMSVHAFHNGPLIGKSTVTELTTRFRERYDTHHLSQLDGAYVISDDGSGNPVLMNPAGQIFLYLHEEDELELLYSSFDDLLKQTFP